MVTGIAPKFSTHRAPWREAPHPSPCRLHQCMPMIDSRTELSGFLLVVWAPFHGLVHRQMLRLHPKNNGILADIFYGSCSTHFFSIFWTCEILCAPHTGQPLNPFVFSPELSP